MQTFITITHYLPILTTIISALFAWEIMHRYRLKRRLHLPAYHLLWWGIGIITYGVGTLIESINTLWGWSEPLFKAWYIAGALLGGAPLAIGTLYLLGGLRAGHSAVTLLCLAVGITSLFVILSPVQYELVDPTILNSKVLAWQRIRLVSPFINGTAFLLLVGGAFYSAWLFFRDEKAHHVSAGNILIAVGAILPGVGGMGSRMGHTELLYIGEFVGVLLIWWGYRLCLKPYVPTELTGGVMPGAV
jgi:hypothetical protein